MSPPGGIREGPVRRPAKDADEELARLFLGSVLGVPVTLHDERAGHSTYDLEICYPDGSCGAAEVGSTRAPKQWAQARAIGKAGYTTDERLTHLWIACVSPDAVISHVLPALPDFLAALERAGITNLSRNLYYGPAMRERLPSMRRKAHDRG